MQILRLPGRQKLTHATNQSQIMRLNNQNINPVLHHIKTSHTIDWDSATITQQETETYCLLFTLQLPYLYNLLPYRSSQSITSQVDQQLFTNQITYIRVLELSTD